MLTKGKIVTIYEDPYTQTHNEGNAVIVEVEEVDEGVNYCQVHFVGDEPGFNVLRVVIEEASDVAAG